MHGLPQLPQLPSSAPTCLTPFFYTRSPVAGPSSALQQLLPYEFTVASLQFFSVQLQIPLPRDLQPWIAFLSPLSVSSAEPTRILVTAKLSVRPWVSVLPSSWPSSAGQPQSSADAVLRMLGRRCSPRRRIQAVLSATRYPYNDVMVAGRIQVERGRQWNPWITLTFLALDGASGVGTYNWPWLVYLIGLSRRRCSQSYFFCITARATFASRRPLLQLPFWPRSNRQHFSVPNTIFPLRANEAHQRRTWAVDFRV